MKPIKPGRIRDAEMKSHCQKKPPSIKLSLALPPPTKPKPQITPKRINHKPLTWSFLSTSHTSSAFIVLVSFAVTFVSMAALAAMRLGWLGVPIVTSRTFAMPKPWGKTVALVGRASADPPGIVQRWSWCRGLDGTLERSS